MLKPSPRRLAMAAAMVLLTGCGSSGSGAAGAETQTIEVALTDAGCEPASISATAGPTTFHVSNAASAAVTEFEVLKGTRILGEVENVAAGLDRRFSITLAPGSYTTKCTGGADERGSLEVAETTSGATGDLAAERAAAVDAYLDYVTAESMHLGAAVRPFVAAIEAGDVAQAKSLFAKARYHYETIEPIAESFGDLDPAIDAREGDVPADEWSGFHRIEKALWDGGNIDDLTTVVESLGDDIADLQARIGTIELEPAQIANGAVELLNEVSASKITGEEDRYSHTDLSDFAANLAGAQAAYEAIRPLLVAGDNTLATTIDARFADAAASLSAHEDPAGIANGYVTYDSLNPAQTRALSQSIDALAEPLSRVAALVLQ